jgi:acetoin utilization protein AcuB
MEKLTIREFMAASPHTIGVDQSLEVARTLMRRFRIRHLPVLHGGQLVGLLTDRDVELIGGLPGVDPLALTVGEAMSVDPYAISPDTSLEWIAADMAERRRDCAVIVERGHVVGVFTLVDALRAFASLLGRARRRRASGQANHQPKA